MCHHEDYKFDWNGVGLKRDAALADAQWLEKHADALETKAKEYRLMAKAIRARYANG